MDDVEEYGLLDVECWVSGLKVGAIDLRLNNFPA